MKPAVYFDQSWNFYVEKISTAFKTFKGSSSLTVNDLFKRGGVRDSAAGHVSFELYGNEFWRSATPTEREGYIEGIKTCPAAYRQFSRDTAYYVSRLNKLYNVDDAAGENAPEFAGSVINALRMLK